jgi:hypothetical protein
VIDMLKAVPGGIVQMLNGIGQNVIEHPVLGNLPALADTFRRVAAAGPSATLTSIGSAVRGATPEQVGANVLAPALAGGAVNAGVGAAAGVGGAEAAELASPAGQLGLRTTKTRPVSSTLAGSSAGPTLDIQNQRVASSVLGADVGVPHSSPVTAETLATARQAPGAALDAGYSLVQPGPLSPAARAQVAAARGPATITKPTPNVEARINDIEGSLLDPNGNFTGEQLRATRNSLSSDADAAANSDDADRRAVAAYQRQVVQAIDQHVVDSLPENSAISPDVMRNARATLAKSYTLQDLIGKGGDIDLQALATLHRKNPGLLTGNTRTVAQFASDNPAVTGGISDATRIAPPSLGGDIAHINILNPRSWVQPLVGALGRRGLRGPSGEAIGAAMQAPVTGLGGEFDLAPMQGLTPPPGTAFEPSQRGITAPTRGLTPYQEPVQLQPPPGTAFEPLQRGLDLGEELAPTKKRKPR